MKVQLQILFQKMNLKIKKIKNILKKVLLMKRQKKYKLNKKIKKKSSSLLEEYILQNLIALIH